MLRNLMTENFGIKLYYSSTLAAVRYIYYS